MNQAKNNRVLLCAVAAGLLLLSLPTTWLTIRNPQLQSDGSPFGNMAAAFATPLMSGVQLKVTGLNGALTLAGLSAPIWLLTAGAVGAIGIAALNAAGVTSVPQAVPSAGLVVVGIFFAIGSLAFVTGKATPGLGYLLAVVGLGMGIFASVTPIAAPTNTSTSDAPS